MGHEHVADDGTKIAFRIIGDGKQRVLLCHGWMVSSKVFDDLLPLLDLAGVRLVVPDLRGAGHSQRPASGYTLERFGRDIVGLLRAEGEGPAVLVGHSMGGQLVQWVAAEAPELVSAVAMLCPVPAAGMPLPPDYAALFRGCGGQRDAQATILSAACKQLSDDARERLLGDGLETSAQAIAEGFDAWTGGGFEQRLGAIKARSLVIATDDPFLPPALLRDKVTSKIAGARLAHLPGPGHYPQVEAPRPVAALLEAFLAGVIA